MSGNIITFESVNYLLIVVFSASPFADIIAEVERVFCDFGAPEIIMSNNGSPFDCAEFCAFCDRRNIRAVSSSPTYAQSDGLLSVISRE